jgi:hypothetical protein
MSRSSCFVLRLLGPHPGVAPLHQDKLPGFSGATSGSYGMKTIPVSLRPVLPPLDWEIMIRSSRCSIPANTIYVEVFRQDKRGKVSHYRRTRI